MKEIREMRETKKMKKYVLIWLVVTFLITTIVGFGIINPKLTLSGAVRYFISVIEFAVVGLIVYEPIKKKFE